MKDKLYKFLHSCIPTKRILANFFFHYPLAITSILLIVITLGTSSTYAYMSPNVTRYDRLYPLKQIIENIEYSLAFTDSQKIDTNLHFASRRKDELKTIYNRGLVDPHTAKQISYYLQTAHNLAASLPSIPSKQAKQKILESSQSIKKDLESIIETIETSLPEDIQKTPPSKKDKLNEFLEDMNKISDIPKKENEVCQDGKCKKLCHNDCSAGEKQCSKNGYRICGNYDNDSCTEWSEISPCSSESTCSKGVCKTPTPTCTNECSQKSARKCHSNGYQICGNFDSDSCLEWSEINLCSKGTNCSNGVCKTSCTNECTTNSKRKCTENGYQICGNFDSDNCLEWSEVNNCPSGTSCSMNICK